MNKCECVSMNEEKGVCGRVTGCNALPLEIRDRDVVVILQIIASATEVFHWSDVSQSCKEWVARKAKGPKGRRER